MNAFDPDGGLPVFLIPLAKGAVGAFVDASAQVSISMINGKSFYEAVGGIDYTSVGASFVTSAIVAPGMSTGAKVVTGIAIGIDAAVDINGNGQIQTIGGLLGETKDASSIALDVAASIVPEKVIDKVSSGLSKAIEKDLTSKSAATLPKDVKASMKHTKDVIDNKGIPGANTIADFSTGLIKEQTKKITTSSNK